jgi:hypothetical protein
LTEKQKDDIIKKNKCFNHILLNKHPYFFRYLYKETNNKFRKYYSANDNLCLHHYGITLRELMNLEVKTDEQQRFLRNYYYRMPVIYSDSTMNVLCRYLEGFKEEISQQVAIVDQTDFYEVYKNPTATCSKRLYNKIRDAMKEHLKARAKSRSVGVYTTEKNNKEADGLYFEERELLKAKFLNITNNIDIIVNCLVDFFYQERPKSNKEVLWFAFGDIIFNNVKNNTKGKIYFPIEDKNGDILYLGKKFSWKEVTM